MSILRAAAVSALALTPLVAAAIPEQDYAAAFARDVQPWYFDGSVQGYFSGVDDVPIHHVRWEIDHEKGAVVWLNGLGGSTLMDMEFLHDVVGWDYSVYSLDHRGQGFSGRLIKENRYKDHVVRFQDYVDDVHRFIQEIVMARPHERIILGGMSMGGAIATVYAEQHPTMMDGLVLVVPANKPRYAQFPEDVAALIGMYASVEGKKEQYAIGQDDPKPWEWDPNDGVPSHARWEQLVKLQAQFPEVVMGGPTYGWAWEMMKATRWSRSQAGRIVAPTLMQQAGADKLVDNKGSTAVCQRARHCRHVEYDRASHGIFDQADEIRDRVMADMHEFVDGVPPRAQGCSSAGVGGAGPALVLLLALWTRRRY